MGREELRFEAVKMGLEIDEFVAVGGSAGKLGEELVDGSGALGFDIAACAKGSHGPLGPLAEEDLVEEVGADVAVVGGEVGFQGCVVGGEPAEEDGDELEFVDVFGGVGWLYFGFLLLLVFVFGGVGGVFVGGGGGALN